MEFFLLAKIGWGIQVIEKVCYGVMALYGVAIVKRYVTDYKDSVEEEKLSEQFTKRGEI